MTLAGKLFAGGAIAAGIFCIAAGSASSWEKYEAQHWLAVKASIQSSSVRCWRSSKGSTTYRPQIAYTYAVGTNTYRSDVVRFGPQAVGRAEAEETSRRFPQGAEAVAYVDPGAPYRAVLDHDLLSSEVKWEIGDGLALVVAGVVLWLAVRDLR